LLVLAPVSAGEVLQQACAFARPMAHEKQITLTIGDITVCRALATPTPC